MSSLIEMVWRQALNTFNFNNRLKFEENFSKLKALTNRITASDVCLKECLSRRQSIQGQTAHKRHPPVTYVEIFENSEITMGIFALNESVKLPLHDHPKMHGLLKVISGTVRIQSYSLISPEERSKINIPRCRFTDNMRDELIMVAVKLPEITVNEKDDVCVLTPEAGNLHEITALDGPAAFLDILSPPYESDFPYAKERSCRYYAEIPLQNGENPEQAEEFRLKNLMRLVNIPSPSDYWSDSAPYLGPPLSSE